MTASGTLVAVEAQLVSAAQRHIQLRLGLVDVQHGDGWVLFQTPPLAEDSSLPAEVQRLCVTLVRDLTSRVKLRLMNEEEEVDFTTLMQGEPPLQQMQPFAKLLSGATAGLLPHSTSLMTALGEKTASSVVQGMLELLYADAAAERRAGVCLVTDFPAALCASGTRCDVVMRGTVCIKAYSHTVGNNNASLCGQAGTTAASSSASQQQQQQQLLSLVRKEREGSVGAEDGLEATGHSPETRLLENSFLVRSFNGPLTTAAAAAAAATTNTSTSSSSNHSGKPCGLIWLDIHTIAQAFSSYATALIEQQLPAQWRTKAFALSEATTVLATVYDTLVRYWRHNPHHERTKANALALLAIVTGDIREYVKGQLALYGADWRGVWRIELGKLAAIVQLCRQWRIALRQLTRRDWPDWDGGTYHDESFDHTAARVKDVWQLRRLLSCVTQLNERLPDTLLPESIFAQASVHDLRQTPMRRWRQCLVAFYKEFSFLEPSLRNRLKQLLRGPADDNQLRLVLMYSPLLNMASVRSAVERPLESIATYLVQHVEQIEQRYSSATSRAKDEPAARLRAAAAANAACGLCLSQARQLFEPGTTAYTTVLQRVQALLGNAAKDAQVTRTQWCEALATRCAAIAALPDAVRIASLEPRTNSNDNSNKTKEPRLALGEGAMEDMLPMHARLECTIHDEVLALIRDARSLRVYLQQQQQQQPQSASYAASDAASQSDESSDEDNRKDEEGDDEEAAACVPKLSEAAQNTLLACEELVRAALRTQQCVANFNAVLCQMLPSTRAMLSPSVERARGQLLYADSLSAATNNTRAPQPPAVHGIAVGNYRELPGLNLRFQNAVEALSSDNRHIRRFHCDLAGQVAALQNIDLTRHMDQWRAAVDTMRSGFDEFVAQRRLTHCVAWRRHWDCQIYKALEFQYRRGLESLHENMAEFKVDLVFKQGGVQFRPSLEAIREAYYVKLREFVSVPLRFRGLQAKREGGSYEIYPLMPIANRERIVTVHTKAVELFAKVNRVRKAFRSQVVVGLCGTGGTADLDSIVDAWAQQAEAARLRAQRRTARARKESATVKSNSRGKKRSEGEEDDTQAAAAATLSHYADAFALVHDRLDKLAGVEEVMRVDCMALGTTPVKAAIEEQLHRLEEALLNHMRRHIQQSIKDIDGFVFNACNVIERRPTTMDEVGRANKAFREYRRQLPEYERRLTMVEAQCKELRQRAGATLDLGPTRTRWEHLREAMALHAKTMESAVRKMRVSLDGLLQRFAKDVSRFANHWGTQKGKLVQAFVRADDAAIAKLLPALKDQMKDVDDLVAQAEELRAKCDYFSEPAPNFLLLDKVVADTQHMSAMWALYDAFQAQLGALRAEDWLTFRAHMYHFEDFCKEWRLTLDKHVGLKTMKGAEGGSGGQESHDEDDAQVIARYLLQLLSEWSSVVPLLRLVRGEGWMSEHWSELFRLLGLDKTTVKDATTNASVPLSSTSLTFGHLIDHYRQLLEKQAELKALQARAQGEIQIREALQDLRTWALEAVFTLVLPSDATTRKVKLITEWKDVMTQVSDNQALVASLKDSPFFAFFADEAAGWEGHLVSLAESLTLLNSIQRKWTYLEPIFARGALPQEQARFKRVDKEFTGILHEIESDPRVMSLTAQADFNDRLRTILEQTERCQRSLMEYLEAKRDKLPRFYFISDEDLLEILGHSNNPRIIQAHLKKLFAGIHAVVFDATATAITHMVSAEGERVALQQPVPITDAQVEDWLIRLDACMRLTLQQLLQRCVTAEMSRASLTERLSRRVIEAYPGQVLQVAVQVRFARDVEAALRAHTLKDLLQDLRAELQHCTTLAAAPAPAPAKESTNTSEDNNNDTNTNSSSSNDAQLTRLKLKALIMDLIHNIAVVELLIENKVTKETDWLWRKQLRYYLEEETRKGSSEQQGGGGGTSGDGDGSAAVCTLRMVDASFVYSYEYQGNAPKLVHTPLTDRCYLTLTQGMQLGYGGNPYGPAGTGKTESVKALGNAMGRQVLVFNCDEGIDFKSMGRIFVGIVKCGAWGCFDEFNRLKIDQLSAISQMIQVIQEALKNGDNECHLLGRSIDVNANAGIFVTLNPAGKGYGGRTKLPDNLKQLFREVAMSAPDKELITATMLLAEGFVYAKGLARKVVELYALCEQLMSRQQHYDWGLRPLKAVLQLGGVLLQRRRNTTKAEEDTGKDAAAAAAQKNEKEAKNKAGNAQVQLSEAEETELMVQSLKINTLSKLTYDDARVFRGLLQDIFVQAARNAREVSYVELEAAVKAAARELGLQPMGSQLRKVLQLYEAMNRRMGVVLVGPSGSGKSTIIRLLRRALELMKVAVPLYVVNPKALPRDQLLGHMDPDTREWFDGVLTDAARKVVKASAQPRTRPWVLCDGDIDPEWVESLNSVLDDNKLLTMPNGVRIQFGDSVNFLFETHSLQYASPATVSRMGVLFFSDEDIHLEPVVASVLAGQPAERRGELTGWIEKYVYAAIDEVMRDETALLLPITRMSCLHSCLHHVLGAVNENDFVFALLRGLGSALTAKGAKQLASWLYSHSAVKPCSESRPLYSYWDSTQGRVVEYGADMDSNNTGGATVTSEAVSAESLLAGSTPIVKTREVQRLMAVLAPLVRCEASPGGEPTQAALAARAFFLVGPEGCGKGALLQACFAQWAREAASTSSSTLANTTTGSLQTAVIHCSAQTTSAQVLQKFEQLCTLYSTNNGRVYRPREASRLVLILKGINLPKPDRYGTVELHAFLQQLLTNHGFYSAELEWIGIERVQIVASMNPAPSPGRYAVAPRLLAMVNLVGVAYPSKTSLMQIYTAYWSGLLRTTTIGQGKEYEGGQLLAQFVLNVYERVRRRFEGEGYEHVVFCPRHLTNWVTNVLLYNLNDQHSPDVSLPTVLAYEGNRLFADPLPRLEDRARVAKILNEQLALLGYATPTSTASGKGRDEASARGAAAAAAAPLFVTWLRQTGAAAQGTPAKATSEAHDDDNNNNNGATRMINNTISSNSSNMLLLEQHSYEAVMREVEQALLRYSREYRPLGLARIPEAVAWVARLDRIFAKPAGGHALVVGRPGVGRRDTVLLAAYMQRMELVTPNLTRDYQLRHFRNDLRAYIQRAVSASETRVVLLLEDQHLLQDTFLELVNDLVSSDDVAGLFTPEELEVMYNAMRESAASEGFIGPISRYFAQRLQNNLHVALILDPTHEDFLRRLQANPGLLSRCEMLYMGAWSADVSRVLCSARLESCLAQLLEDSNTVNSSDGGGGEGEKLTQDGVAMRELCARLPQDMLSIHLGLGPSLSTPKDFEVLMDSFCMIIDRKRQASQDGVQRLEAGLAKLQEAETSVAAIKADVETKKADVQAMQRQADKALNEIQERMQASQDQRSQAAELEERLKEEHADIVQKRQSVEEELGGIRPLLDAARDAVSAIRGDQLNEIRSLKAPPEPIRDVLEGVLALLGVTDVSWQSMRNFLGERGAKERILDFDVQTVTPAIRNAVARLLQQKATSFKPEVIHRASLAAAPMADWVKAMVQYATITERIAPLTRQLTQLEANQREGEERLGQLRTTLRAIDTAVEQLRKDFARKCKEAGRLRARLQRAEADLAAAEDLLAKLGGERTRWAQEAATIRAANRAMPRRALLAAAFMTYLGHATEEVRAGRGRGWAAQLGLEASAAVGFARFMRSESELLRYKTEGLPGDELSLENAVLVLDTVQTPLLIDPANQAVEWVKAHLQAQHVVVEVVAMHDERFAHTLELAVRFGKTLLVTEVDTIEGLLYPILRRDLTSAGAKRVVQVGAKTVDWQETFRILLFTRRTDLHLLPGAAALVTVVNFSVTSLGLESQLLALTIGFEQPALERQKVELLSKEEALKLELGELETRLLRELVDCHGDLLGNAQLIQSLNEVKTQASTVQEALAKSHDLQCTLDTQREVYRPFAHTAALLFFRVRDLERLNRIYQFGLNAFIAMFTHTLTSYDGPAALEEKIPRLVRRLAQTCFHDVSLGLLKKDRLAFGLHLLHALLPREGFPRALWNVLVGAALPAGGDKASAAEEEEEEKKDVDKPQETSSSAAGGTRELPAWAPAAAKDKYAAFFAADPAAASALVAQWRLHEDGARWAGWLHAAEPELALLQSPREAAPPAATDTLDARTMVGQLLLVHIFRPDRLAALSLRLILRALHLDALVPATSLEETIRGAGAQRPVLLITTGGSDPSMEVQAIARHVVGAQRLTQIALGGGQTELAMQQLRRCAASGEWLFLKNLHLVLDWAAVLEKELCAMPPPHEEFRLLITSEPHELLPTVLLRMSLKITVEAPPGVKQNVLRTYRTWDRAFLEAQTPAAAQLLFGLAWFHAVVQERRSFVPQGWVLSYEFSPADLKAATDILRALAAANNSNNGSSSCGAAADNASAAALSRTAAPALNWVTLKGLLQSCIYGGRLDNSHDEEVLRQLIDRVFDPDVLLRASRPIYGTLCVPTTNNHDAVMAMLQHDLPDVDPPAIVCLPDNADRAVQEGVAAGQVESLRLLTQASALSSSAGNAAGEGGGGGGGGVAEKGKAGQEGWRARLTPVLALWKASGLATRAAAAMQALRSRDARRPTRENNSNNNTSREEDDEEKEVMMDPMAVFFRSEAGLLATLLGDLDVYFAELAAVADNTQTASAAVREDVAELASGRLPPRWLERMDGPREARPWFALLARKQEMVMQALQQASFSAAALYDLATLLRPHTFLNALRQYTARHGRVPLIDLVLVAALEGDELARSMPVSIRVAGTNLMLQGALLAKQTGSGASSTLAAVAVDSPSSTPLKTNVVLGWVSAQEAQRGAAQYARVPVYANADRQRAIFDLSVRVASAAERDELALHGVACFLASS